MAKTLKVAFVLDDGLDRPDGVQQYITTLGEWLHTQAGIEVYYFVGETKANHPLSDRIVPLAKNITVRGNQNKMSIPLPASSTDISHAFSKIQPDIIHIQMPFSPFMGAKVLAEAHRRAIPIVSSFHIVAEGSLMTAGSRGLHLITKRAQSYIDESLSVSSAAQRFAKQYFNYDSDVSPNVVSVEQFAPEAKLEKQPERISFLGRLVERKGAQHFIEALAVLAKKIDIGKEQFSIIGDGPLRTKLEARVAELGLSDQVTFHGFVSEEEKAALLQESKLAVFPSTGNESFGIVLIEAMSTGRTAVLGGNNVGYSTVLEGAEQQLFDPRDYEAFAASLEQFITDKKARDTAITWQNKRLIDFDVATVGPEMLARYRRVIARNTQI